MKKLFIILSCLFTFGQAFAQFPAPLSLSYEGNLQKTKGIKISVFYSHVLDAVRQEEITEEEMLKEVVAAGIDALDVDGRYLKDEASIVQRMESFAKAGLVVACICTNYDWGYPPFSEGKPDYDAFDKQGKDMIDLAIRVGAKSVMPLPGKIKEADENNPKVWNEATQHMAHVLTVMCEYAKSLREKGIDAPRVVLEDFDGPRTPYSTIAQLKYLIDEVSGLQIAFDTGNFMYSRNDVMEAYETLKGNIGHVHLKDRVWSAAGQDNPASNESYTALTSDKQLAMYGVPVGSGQIPIAEIIDKLQKSGYDGFYTIEHFGMKHQRETILKSAEWLNRQF